MDPLSPEVAAALAVARRTRGLQGAGVPSSSLPPSVLQALALVNRHRGHFDDGGTVADDGSTAPDFSMDPDLPPPPSTPAGLDANQRWGNAIVQEGSNIANGIASAVTLPRDVMQGTVDPMSDQGIQRALNLATMLPAGGMPMAERGALGSAGGALTTPALQDALSPAVAAEPSLEDLFAAWGGASPTSSPKASVPPATAAELQQRIDSLNPNKLPMDQPSRLARAQDLGFDTSTPLYHGTPNQWEGTGFRDTDELRAERATFLTPNPDVATAYSSANHSTDGAILPVFARMQNPMVVDMGGAGHSGLDAAIEAARSAGHDALVAHNVLDLSGYNYDEVPQTQVAIFDPRNIRSVHATFDPAMEQSSDLLSAGGLSALPQDDRQRRAHGGSVMPPGLTPDQKHQWFSKGGQVESRMDAARRLMKEAGISSPAEFHISQVLRAVDTNNPEIVRATMADVARTHRPPRPVHPEDRSAIPASVRQALHATQGYAYGGAVTSGMTPSVAAALRIAQAYARGGSIAPGLPVAPFQPIAAPHTVMPRIAAGHVPRILPMARGHFADGGSTLPPHVLHALAIVHDHARQHFADGGTTLGIGDAPHPQGVLLNGDFGQGSGGSSAGSGTTLEIGDAPHPQGVLLNGNFGQSSGTTGGSPTGTQAGNMQLGGLQLGGGEGSTLASLTGDPSGGASASTIGGTITPGGSTSGAPGGFATGWQPNTLTPINNNASLGSRPQFAKGGPAMHPSVLRALALVNQPRGHFDDGGNAGGGDSGGSESGGGDSSGSGDSSSSSDRSGGGFSSGASSGADSNSPSSGGGGFSSGASSGADSASSSGGGLGMGGGGIGGAVGSSNSSSSSAGSSDVGSSGGGGFSSGAASGQDSSSAGPASSATSEASGVMGGAPLGGAAVASSAPASAPASTDAGFGNPSNPAAAQSSLSGFGAFGSQPNNVSAAMANAPNPFGAAPSAMKSYNADGTVNSSPASSPYGGMPSSMTGVTSNMAPSATDNIAGSMQSPAPGSFGQVGFQNATPGALSNPAGFSTGDLSANPTNQGLATNPFGSMQQHAAADPGEDGTTGMGPADATAGGFSPYGGMPASMTGVTSDTAMASPNVGTFGDIGVGPLSSPIGASPLSNPGVMGALAASAPASCRSTPTPCLGRGLQQALKGRKFENGREMPEPLPWIRRVTLTFA